MLMKRGRKRLAAGTKFIEPCRPSQPGRVLHMAEPRPGGIAWRIGGRGEAHRACQAGIGMMERAGKLEITPARS